MTGLASRNAARRERRAPRWVTAVAAVMTNVALVQVAAVDVAGAAHGTFAHFAQLFDGVAAPALPGGWTATCNACQSGDTSWRTEEHLAYTPPNTAVARTTGHKTDKRLESPAFTYPTGARLEFLSGYTFEGGVEGSDGGVLEISIGSGSYTDIFAAGGTAGNVDTPYDAAITSSSSAINGRRAWTGNSLGNGLPEAQKVNLPNSGAGQSVRLRWRMVEDTGGGNSGNYWLIDEVRVVTDGRHVTIEQAAGQNDPTASSTINFTAVFSASVTGFTGDDVSFTGSTATGLSAVVSGGPTTYNVAVSATGSGSVKVSLPLGLGVDQGNENSTSADNSVLFDASAPACSFTIVAGPPKRIDFSVQDVHSGIASITVATSVNIKEVAISFTPGTTDPVLFTAEKDDPTRGSQVAIVLADTAGNRSSCI